MLHYHLVSYLIHRVTDFFYSQEIMHTITHRVPHPTYLQRVSDLLVFLTVIFFFDVR
jgi:hypothetical protein